MSKVEGLAYWTEARTEYAKTRWLDGASAGTIALELNRQPGAPYCTRNSVVGKMHRMGLKVATGTRPSPPRPTMRNRTVQVAAIAAPIPVPARSDSPPPSSPPPYDLPETEEAASIPRGQRCTLLDLTDAKCHWPVGAPGEPNFFFCGGTAAEGTPYCGYHCSVAYQPPASRRDRRAPRV